MSRKSLLGGIAPLYQAQEPSLLLMQAKCLACCPLTVFSSTQSNHRHSAGLLIMQGMEVQRVIWNNQRNTKDKGINLQKKKKNASSKKTWVTLLLTTICQHYLAITTHFIALSQALLLGGTRGLPGLNEVTQCDVHRPISLQFACCVITAHKTQWDDMKPDMEMYRRPLFVWTCGVWPGKSCTCDEILLAISLQSHSTHCGGGSSVDGINILVGTLEHLTVQTEEKNIQIHVGIKFKHTRTQRIALSHIPWFVWCHTWSF